MSEEAHCNYESWPSNITGRYQLISRYNYTRLQDVVNIEIGVA